MARLQLNDGTVDMRGTTFRGGQKSSAGVPVARSDLSIENAYNASELHVVMVMGAKSASTSSAQGSNPYYSPSNCRTCFLHATGRDAGLVLIEYIGRQASKGSTANGVTTHDDSGGAVYKLIPIGTSTFS